MPCMVSLRAEVLDMADDQSCSSIRCAVSRAPRGAAGRTEFFFAAMVIYAAANACIGATPAAYAADVMPSAVSGFGLGIYRCAGDIGTPRVCFVNC